MIYSEFADKMTNGKYSVMSVVEKLQYIFDTEEGLYVPIKRQKDYMWLSRNFMIQNSKHPLANDVMRLVKILVKTLKK